MIATMPSFVSRARETMLVDAKVSVPALLLLAAVVPSFVYVTMGATSLALGILIVAVLTIIVTPVSITVVGGCILLSIALYATTLRSGAEGGGMRLALEAIAQGLLFGAAISLGRVLARLQEIDSGRLIPRVFEYANISFIGIGLITIFYRPSVIGYDQYVKNVFPFSEPSHYALALLPFLFFTTVITNNASRTIMLVAYSLIGFLQPSLILLIGVAAALALLFLRSLFLGFKAVREALVPILAVIALAGLLFGPGLLGSSDATVPTATPASDSTLPDTTTVPQAMAPSPVATTYFSERLQISTESTNLTVLVFLQGWDDALRALAASNGWGLGFQSMGILPPSELSERIRSLTAEGEYANRTDGGSLAPKIVFEFGYTGFAVTALLLLVVAFCTWKTVKFSRRSGNIGRILTYCLLFSFSFEYFLRGYGYFSPGVFYAVASLSSLMYYRESNQN